MYTAGARPGFIAQGENIREMWTNHGPGPMDSRLAAH